MGPLHRLTPIPKPKAPGTTYGPYGVSYRKARHIRPRLDAFQPPARSLDTIRLVPRTYR